MSAPKFVPAEIMACHNSRNQPKPLEVLKDTVPATRSQGKRDCRAEIAETNPWREEGRELRPRPADLSWRLLFWASGGLCAAVYNMVQLREKTGGNGAHPQTLLNLIKLNDRSPNQSQKRVQGRVVLETNDTCSN